MPKVVVDRKVYLAQEHPPGRLGLSDFAVADEFGIEIVRAGATRIWFKPNWPR